MVMDLHMVMEADSEAIMMDGEEIATNLTHVDQHGIHHVEEEVVDHILDQTITEDGKI